MEPLSPLQRPSSQGGSFLLHVLPAPKRTPSNLSFSRPVSSPRRSPRGRSLSVSFGDNSLSATANSGGEVAKRHEIATMSDEEKKKMFALFETVDAQRTGSISVDQLVPLLNALGHHLTSEEAMELLQQVDLNMNGTLEFSEFMQLVVIFKDVAQFRLYGKSDGATAILQEDALRWVITPDNRALWFLDVLMMFTLTYIVATVAYMYAFNDVDVIVSEMRRFKEADIVVTFILLLNAAVRFFVTEPEGEKGHLSVTMEDLAWSYATSYLVFDVISVLPLRLFTTDGWAHSVLAHGRLFAAVRWLHVLEAPKVLVISRPYVEFYFLAAPAIKHLCEAFLVAHIMAVLSLRIMYDHVSDYSAAFYQAMYVLAGVGYGDFHPRRVEEEWFLTLACLVAMIANAVVVGSVVEFLARSDVNANRQNVLAQMQAVLSFFEVPVPLQEEILQFQDHILRKDVLNAYAPLTGHLPREIKAGLTLQFRLYLLAAVPIFSRAHETARVMLAQRLSGVLFRPEEYITLADEYGDLMYFVNYGFVDQFTRDGTYTRTLGANKGFGEEAVFGPFSGIIRRERERDSNRSQSSIIATQPYVDKLHRASGQYKDSSKTLTYVEVLTLSASDLTDVLMQFPRFRSEFEHDVTSQYAVQLPNLTLANLQRRRSSAQNIASPLITLNTPLNEPNESPAADAESLSNFRPSSFEVNSDAEGDQVHAAILAQQLELAKQLDALLMKGS